MKDTLTTIFLNDQQARQFVAFQKHFALIGLIDSIGGFDLKNGSITIFFDELGKIHKIDKHQFFKP